ncbi:MAG: indolepyruvate ferredoxin oxidoreductase subunit alpha [Methanosarcinaceae archaeon]|nr:indolepyruvate ferredoxin oxidoreductase subunit alpha [Methanosarcinaceae archaeon]
MSENTDTAGLEALFFGAIDSDVELITAVTGYPITAVAGKFSREKGTGKHRVYWMTNEKAALETALGASVTGQRSMVLVKHVGMNILADPLMTAVLHTIGAGLVILAGDDPAALASQNEQDSRWYGKISELAVLDPATPEDAYNCVKRAFELSEESKVPVIVRVTDRLQKSSGRFERRIEGEGFVVKNEFDRSIWKLTMHGKHQRFHQRSYPLLVSESETSPLNRMTGCGKDIGIISSGYPSAIVEELISSDPEFAKVSNLTLNVVSPFPFGLVRKFIGMHDHILVIEESEDFIESHLNVIGNIRGKNSGHVPVGLVDKEHVEFAVRNIDKGTVTKYTDIQTIEERGTRPICDKCPYMPLYHILRELDVMVAGDMGCSIRAAPGPLAAVDTGFSLGGAISTACGFREKGVAVIGDFGLAHSGIVGLINAVNCGFDVLVIILDNRVAAMTGGQETPELMETVRTLVPDMTVYDIDESIGIKGIQDTRNELEGMIRRSLASKGVSVLYVKGKCILY